MCKDSPILTVKVDNKYERRKMQELAFELGYFWTIGDTIVEDWVFNYLHFKSRGRLTHSSDKVISTYYVRAEDILGDDYEQDDRR